MQLIKERGDVIRFFLEKDESCSVVLYSLKDFDRRIRKTDEKRVTVVNVVFIVVNIQGKPQLCN